VALQHGRVAPGLGLERGDDLRHEVAAQIEAPEELRRLLFVQRVVHGGLAGSKTLSHSQATSRSLTASSSQWIR